VEPAFDYLVVSDLHLRGGFNNPTQGLYHFDEEFADFLRYYRLHRSPSQRWRLVIGGDFIEFLYITDLPNPSDRLLRGARFGESEYRYGANTEAQKSRWKLDTILRSGHPQLLLALARFVLDGNEIVILRGNHDIEMSWPEVQEHFRRLIAEHHPADVAYMTMKELVAERVQFPEWFYVRPGEVYVEHGSQYDPFCATQHVLYPVVPGAPQHVQFSIGELAIRYFTNQMKLINAMAAENIMSVSEYIVWVFRGNLGAMPRIARLYVGMVRRILAKSGRPEPDAERRVRVVHEQRVTAVDERFGLPRGTATAVDAMRARPVMRRRWAAVRFLALDVLATGLGLVVAAIAILVWFPARSAWLVVLGVSALLGLIGYAFALRMRRITEVVGLRRTADRIARLFGVRYVVLGHSHAAGSWALANGTTYVNVGTWVPDGSEGFFVYFKITEHDGRREGRLWRWNKRKVKPEPFGAPG